jgi:hypothetical protein
MKGKQETKTGRETMMRKLIIVPFVVAAALLGETEISNAQSSSSYPWCAILPGADSGSGGAMSCYYASWEQCRTTMFGIGGLCVASPYYHGQAAPLPRHSGAKLRHRRHA